MPREDSFIESIFHLMGEGKDYQFSATEIFTLFNELKDKINPELLTLFQKVTSAQIGAEKSLTLNFSEESSTNLTLGGFTVQLKAEKIVQATIVPEEMGFSHISGLKAGTGFLQLELKGVFFKRDGDSFLVDLETNMKTFTIKIPSV